MGPKGSDLDCIPKVLWGLGFLLFIFIVKGLGPMSKALGQSLFVRKRSDLDYIRKMGPSAYC